MIKKPFLLCALALRLASAQQSDSVAPRPAFEVASIKPTDLSLRQQIDMRVLPGGTLTATAVSLKFLITVAYGVQSIQVSGGPGWLDEEKFDILAKPPEGAKPQLLPMLQSLLEDRFKLVIRRETRELSVYELKLAKAGQLGPRLKEAEPGDCPVEAVLPGTVPCGGFLLLQGRLTGHKVQPSALTKPLSNVLGRPVVDKTGITTKFEITLEWTPDQNSTLRAEVAPPNPDLPSIFTALQEQLGLKLEAAKESTEILVIERAEKSSEN